MKKIVFVFCILLSTLCMNAQQNDGGVFNRGKTIEENTEMFSRGGVPGLPGHGEEENQPASPIGSGLSLLISFGAAYAMYKKNKK